MTIFVSHHSSKKEIAEHMVHYLERRGHKCWIAPRDISPGIPWDQEILKGLHNSTSIVLLFCSSADGSRHVRRELELADKANLPIFPVKIEDVEPVRLDYFLSSPQWFNWLDHRDDKLEKLSEALFGVQSGTYFDSVIKAKIHHAGKSPAPQNANEQYELGVQFQFGESVTQSDTKAVKWYAKAAEQGQPDAQWRLGFMYSVGRGVSKSNKNAVKWYRKAAEQGNATGQSNLGYMYYNGWGVEESNEVAVKWFQKAAEQGDVDGQWNLGYMHKEGCGVTQSSTEAVKWFQKAAEQEHEEAQYNLGMMYANGKGGLWSDTKAVKWYQKAAEQGHVKAQHSLGLMYFYGKGVPQSNTEAVKWYQKAAEQGHVKAQYSLGVMYRDGYCVTQSDVEAVKWYQKAVEQEHAESQHNLGVMYETGKGVKRSYEKAFELYKKSAKHGNSSGAYSLSCLYEQGLGVEISSVEAKKWLTKAADQRNTSAQYKLGQIAEKTKSTNTGAMFYDKAASAGMRKAQLKMAFLYEEGIGVNRDETKAAKYFYNCIEFSNEAVAGLVRLARAKKNTEAQYLLHSLYKRGDIKNGKFIDSFYTTGTGLVRKTKSFLLLVKVVLKNHKVAKVETWNTLTFEFGYFFDEWGKRIIGIIGIFLILLSVGLYYREPLTQTSKELWKKTSVFIDQTKNEIKIGPNLDSNEQPLDPAGSQAKLVRSVQTELLRLGYEIGPADGIVGERTIRAIRDFEQKIGRTSTGEVTPLLLIQLQNEIRNQ